MSEVPAEESLILKDIAGRSRIALAQPFLRANRNAMTVSRPRLEHRASDHSVTASEDYQSASSGRSRPTSPSSPTGLLDTMDDIPSRPQQHAGLVPSSGPRAESFQPSTQSAFARLQRGAREGKPTQPQQIQRKAIGSLSSGQSSSDSNNKVSETVTVAGPRYRDSGVVTPPTPGIDDSQYIRFALDQLTRDEEVRGSRAYPTHDRWTTAPRPSENAFRSTEQPTSPDQTSRTLVGTAVPFMQANASARPTQGRYQPQPNSTTQPPAGTRPVRTGLEPGGDGRLVEGADDDDNGYHTPTEELPHERFVQPHTSPPRAEQPVYHAMTTSQSDGAFFVPYDQEETPLKFLPGILKPLWLGLFIFLCCLVLAGLIFSGIWSAEHNGLYRYTAFGDSRYFVFQYLPLLIAMFLLLWLLQIQVAIQRVAPFIAMASFDTKSRSRAPLMAMQPTNFLFPQLQYLRAGQPLVGLAMIIFWLQIFTIPLFATLYNVYYSGPASNGAWRWTTVQYIVWVLVGLYGLLVCALVLVGT